MWTKLDQPEVFFRARNGEKRTEAILSFADGTGNFCHLTLENGFFSLWRTVGSDVNQGAAFVRYERMVEWPKEVLEEFMDCKVGPLEVLADSRMDVIESLLLDKDKLAERVAELEAHNERLTSERFSGRNHIALQSRATSAEAELARLQQESDKLAEDFNFAHEGKRAAEARIAELEAEKDKKSDHVVDLAIPGLHVCPTDNAAVTISVEELDKTLHPERKNAGKRGKRARK